MRITGTGIQEKLLQNPIQENKEADVSFGTMLKEKLQEVNDLQIRAEESSAAFIRGEDISVHEVMLNTEEAKLSLQFAVQIRNKMIEAYQEINRLQL